MDKDNTDIINLFVGDIVFAPEHIRRLCSYLPEEKQVLVARMEARMKEIVKQAFGERMSCRLVFVSPGLGVSDVAEFEFFDGRSRTRFDIDLDRHVKYFDQVVARCLSNHFWEVIQKGLESEKYKIMP